MSKVGNLEDDSAMMRKAKEALVIAKKQELEKIRKDYVRKRIDRNTVILVPPDYIVTSRKKSVVTR